MRTIAKQGENVFLLTADDKDPPAHVQVLDLNIGRLYPPYPRDAVLKAGEWEMLKGRAPNADAMLVGIEVMPSHQDVLYGFNVTAATG